MATATATHQQQYSPKIQKRTLKGHRKPVLCLAHSSERRSYYHSNKNAHDSGNKDALSSNDRLRPQHRHPPSLLLSGSEDGTVRLWDLRTRKTALCMVIPSADDEDGVEVTSVAFHPSISEERRAENGVIATNGDGDVQGNDNNTSLPLQNDCTVYASASNRVYGYDLRHHTSALPTIPVIKKPHFDLTSSFGCSDEINQLSFSFPKRNDGSGKYMLAAADDCGEAHIVECLPSKLEQEQSTTTEQNHKAFHHAERQTMAITSSALFQPRTNNDSYLATGGTDCTVKLWDVAKPQRKPTAAIRIVPAASENTVQICNPPYVHSLSWSPSGRLLAAGVGDGSCAVFRAEGRRLSEAGRLGVDEGGHASAVAAVCFPSFGSCHQRGMLSSSSRAKFFKSGEAEDRLMISAGNDGNILFWDLGGNMVGNGPLDPASYLGGCISPEESKPAANDDGLEDTKDATTKAMDSLRVSNPKGGKKNRRNKKKRTGKGKDMAKNENDAPCDSIIPSPPKILFQIAHRQKPNWITCSKVLDEVLPASLFVADTTNNISVYTLPI